MADEIPKVIDQEEEDDERAAERVDLASLIDEEDPITPEPASDDVATADVVATRKVDLDGDSSGWEYGDESDEEETEEESYEESHDAV